MRPEVQVLPGPLLSSSSRDGVLVKRLVLAVVAVVGGLAVVRRRKARQDERSLWHEATTAPDLR